MTSTRVNMAALGAAAVVAVAAGLAAAESAAPPEAAATAPPPTRAIRLSTADGGIGFDDLGFSARLRKVLVPAGGTGRIDLIDPDALTVTPLVLGSPRALAYKGGHGDGITSVDSDGARLFAVDRTSRRVLVVDPATGKLAGAAPLTGHPDYVRWVGATRELWVTEPHEQRIEIFALKSGDAPTAAGTLRIEGGPESLVIDDKGRRAFTHLWNGVTLAVDVRERAVRGRWSNGCQGSRGIALDEPDGIVFAACDEGKLVTLDANQPGRELGAIDAGRGVDVIDYAPSLRHAYVPGADSGDMTVVDVSPRGQLKILRTVPAAKGAHCVTADDRGHAWICDPAHGQLLLFTDARS